MGVSGSGKSTVAEGLAKRLNCAYFDADDFHPEANVKKMSSGQPLNDDDRQPWLERLHKLIQETLGQGQSCTLACSALKESYRDVLAQGGLEIVYLQGSFELIWERMRSREGHYMKADMLKSQFETLEEPKNVLTLSITEPPEQLIERIINKLNLAPS